MVLHVFHAFPRFSFSPDLIDKVAALICLIFSFYSFASISESSFLPRIPPPIVNLMSIGARELCMDDSIFQDYYSDDSAGDD